MSDTKYTVYKVTNRFDNKIYIGVHAQRSDNDRYMGSGTEIREALKKEGRKSFIKEILFVFDTKEEMLVKERELVTKEFCMREDTYNRIIGGGGFTNSGMATVRDKEGNTMMVYCNDPRYISGELVHINNGRKMSNKTKEAIYASNIGRSLTQEHKDKVSKTLKKKYAAGEKIGGMGSIRTDEMKKAASDRNLLQVKNGTYPSARKINQFDMNDILIKTWNSFGEIERELGFDESNIIYVCKGFYKDRKRKSAYGFKWKFQDA